MKSAPGRKEEFDYAGLTPPDEIKYVERQAVKRHFGVHGYFTKQAWKVVHAHVERFSRRGDVVLDPYGGTGVTLVEALALRRKGIHVDINPLSIFIVKNLLAPVNFDALNDAYTKVVAAFRRRAPRTEAQVEAALNKYPYPKAVPLMKNADVASIEQLFHPTQLAQLACLKHLILKVEDEDVRGVLLLMFSGLINKINLTYHASGDRSEGRGDSSVFRYYRFRLAPQPAALDVLKYFESRFKKVVDAKKEIATLIRPEAIRETQIYQGTATDLDRIENETVDYIYTDPPYGSKIPYLDLSIMFTAWLDLPIKEKAYELEAIEGGELKKSKESYAALIAQSIKEMYRVLKFNRWLSFVFAHKDPAYWHMIVETAERVGFEYAGAVQQRSNQASFKKRQNPFTVLHGQLIINFKKVENPKTIMRVSLGADIADIVIQTIEGVIAKNHGATVDEINDELIIKGLELGFLDILGKEYQDLTPLLREQFDYHEDTAKYHIRKNTKFKANIDVHVRIRYYLIAYLRRMAHQHRAPTFDEIVLHIMPLLKNGKTPERQTILSVLEALADRVGEDSYRLRTEGQQRLFDKA
ncbi:MAG TPA: DNA methyltransferase [Pyrinomonadaceae bacterium]